MSCAPYTDTTTSVKKTAKHSHSVEAKSSKDSVKPSSGEDKKTKLEVEKEAAAGAAKKKQKKKKKKVSSDNKVVESPSNVEGEKSVEKSGVKEIVSGGDVVREKGLKKNRDKQTVGNCQDGEVRDGGGGGEMENGIDVSSSCSSPSSTTDSGIGSVVGEEPVAREDQCITRVGSNGAAESNESSVAKEGDTRKRKLHFCACCGSGETIPKSFKRCQK